MRPGWIELEWSYCFSFFYRFLNWTLILGSTITSTFGQQWRWHKRRSRWVRRLTSRCFRRSRCYLAEISFQAFLGIFEICNRFFDCTLKCCAHEDDMVQATTQVLRNIYLYIVNWWPQPTLLIKPYNFIRSNKPFLNRTEYIFVFILPPD